MHRGDHTERRHALKGRRVKPGQGGPTGLPKSEQVAIGRLSGVTGPARPPFNPCRTRPSRIGAIASCSRLFTGRRAYLVTLGIKHRNASKALFSNGKSASISIIELIGAATFPLPRAGRGGVGTSSAAGRRARGYPLPTRILLPLWPDCGPGMAAKPARNTLDR